MVAAVETHETNAARAEAPPPAHDPEHPSPVVGVSKPRMLSVLGPGLITGASDDDPSGIATYSQAGAQFGTALGWTMLLCFPLMVAVQMVSARIGRTTGEGLARNLKRHGHPALLHVIVWLVVFANIINIGADLSAMGASVELVGGGPRWAWVLAFGVLSILMQVFMQYTSYVAWLKWLTLALFAYVATLFLAHVPWGAALTDLVWPKITWSQDYATTVVAVLGTTISPYLFFWQASQEAEDIRAFPRRAALVYRPQQAEGALQRIRLDTIVGMGVSNFVGLAIIWTTAATLHARGVTDIQTSADAARALEPIAGAVATIVFALGVVGTGILAIPVLAGSAAYAVGEARGWKTGLGRQPLEAVSFYVAVALATLLGMGVTFMPMDPIKALYWSAVINGAVAVPVIAAMMSLAARRKVMGNFPVRGLLAWTGWATMIFMAAATLFMVGSWFV